MEKVEEIVIMKMILCLMFVSKTIKKMSVNYRDKMSKFRVSVTILNKYSLILLKQSPIKLDCTVVKFSPPGGHLEISPQPKYSVDTKRAYDSSKCAIFV